MKYREEVERLDDVGLDRGDESNQAVEGSSSASCDEDAADEHHEFSDSSHNQVAHAVAEHSLEAVPSSHAEVLASERDLDVGCLVDELDDSLHAGQAAAETIDSILEALVLVSSRVFGLLLEYFDHHLEELHNCQDEGPECQTTEVIPEGHLETSSDG